jgi:hypothetical protein
MQLDEGSETAGLHGRGAQHGKLHQLRLKGAAPRGHLTRAAALLDPHAGQQGPQVAHVDLKSAGSSAPGRRLLGDRPAPALRPAGACQPIRDPGGPFQRLLWLLLLLLLLVLLLLLLLLRCRWRRGAVGRRPRVEGHCQGLGLLQCQGGVEDPQEAAGLRVIV